KDRGQKHSSIVDAGQIPVLSCLGESKTGQLLNINADVAARELVITLQPHKTIFVNAKGGWLEDGVKVPKLDMSTDYATMAARDYTGRQGTLLKLNEINTLLQALPSTSSVVLTSAAALANEIVSGHSAGGGDHVDAPLHFCSGKKKKVGLMGARGYVGRELIRVLGGHPELDLVVASSRALSPVLTTPKVMDLVAMSGDLELVSSQGYLEIPELLVARGYEAARGHRTQFVQEAFPTPTTLPLWVSERTMIRAASYDHLDMLRHLHEVGGLEWTPLLHEVPRVQEEQ
ncbi:hypothetical protein SPRG_17724, partial [Saprolegnia parasitica CBS 223.65]